MAKYRIKATEPNIVSNKETVFRYVIASTVGNARLTLTPYGDYSLYIISGGVGETTVKRTDGYKRACETLTKEMYDAYAEESAAYTDIHKGMAKITDKSKYESQLNKLAPKKYTRQGIMLPRPTKKDVEDDLINEAKHYLHTHKEDKTTVEEYVKARLGYQTEIRQTKWQEALELFESIENAREEKANAVNFAEFSAEKAKLQDFIDGTPQVIADGFRKLEDSITIPVSLSVDYKYDQKNGIINLDLILEDAVPVAVMKADILASGKLSVKNKLVRELTNDQTRCTIGLLFLISSHIFSISPNIQTIRLSLWNRAKTHGYIWIEFDAPAFTRLTPGRLHPELDIYNYPNLTNIKAKNNALEIVPIDKESFKISIQDKIQNKGKTEQTPRPIHQTEQYSYITRDDAYLLKLKLGNSTIVDAALDEASKSGSKMVRVPSRYLNILSELKG